MSDPKTQAKPADAAAKDSKDTQDEAAVAGAMSAAQAAKKISGKVAVFERNSKGQIVRDAKTGKPAVVHVAIKPEHIVAVGATHAVTVDGTKHPLA